MITDDDEIAAFHAGYDAYEAGMIKAVPAIYDGLEVLRDAWLAGWFVGEVDEEMAAHYAMEAWHDEQDLNTLFNER
jgi:hypothetical protein